MRRDDQVQAALAVLSRAGVPAAELARPTLDDVFFALTGHAAEPEEAGADE